MSLKLFFGILSIIPALFAYYFYFRDVFRGKTKPHAFSWLVWGILSGNGFFAQVSAHGGIGTWATGLTSVASLSIFIFAIYMGTTKPTKVDWVLLSLALTSLLLLLVVDSKETALSLTLFALVIGFVMTGKKAYHKPKEENDRAFWLNTLKFIPAIPALSTYSFLTVTYPVVAAAGNAAIGLIVYYRRKNS